MFVLVALSLGSAAAFFPREHPWTDDFGVTLDVLRISIIPLAGAFGAYLFEKERQLRRLSRDAYEWEQQAAERLRLLYQTKDALLTAVSHEVRTPITKALGAVQLLDARFEKLGDDQKREFVRTALDSLETLDVLLGDLIDLDRLWRDVVEPRLETTDVGALIGRVAEGFDLDGRPLEVDVSPVTAEVDAPKVERIVETLLANARRHTPPGTRVWVRVRPSGDEVEIAVDDAGPGVPEELREAVFRPFRAGPDAPSHAPGTGIGLTLVERLAELHGGRAWVTDREGGGASFRVRLPAEGGRPEERRPTRRGSDS